MPLVRTILARLLARRTRDPDPPTGLHTCALCRTDFVNPVDWEPVGETHWWILLRCGECGTFREVTVENDVTARFEVELHRRAQVLERALDPARM